MSIGFFVSSAPLPQPLLSLLFSLPASSRPAPCRRAIRVRRPADLTESSSSASSPVAIRMTLTALPITSAGRFSPRGPRGIRRPLLGIRKPAFRRPCRGKSSSTAAAPRDPGTIRMPQPLPRRRREHRYHGAAIARVYVLVFFGSPRRCPFGISPWLTHRLLSGKHMRWRARIDTRRKLVTIQTETPPASSPAFIWTATALPMALSRAAGTSRR